MMTEKVQDGCKQPKNQGGVDNLISSQNISILYLSFVIITIVVIVLPWSPCEGLQVHNEGYQGFGNKWKKRAKLYDERYCTRQDLDSEETV